LHCTTHPSCPLLVVCDELKVEVVLRGGHGDPDDLFSLARQVRQHLRLESSQEERFHDPFGVRDAIGLVLGPLVSPLALAILTFLQKKQSSIMQNIQENL
jgi:hypothetical protein